MQRRRLRLAALCVAVGSALLSGCSGEGSGTTAAAGCTYWASMAVDQEISRLMIVEPDGNTSVPSLDDYGQTGPSGRQILGAAQQSVTADGSMVLYAPTSQSAGPFGEGWRLVAGDGTPIDSPDWPDVDYAVISPNGEHVAFTGYDGDGRRSYGVQTLDGQILWQLQDPSGNSGTRPERWVSDRQVWLYDVVNGDASLIDLAGTAIATVPVPNAGHGTPLAAVQPSADLQHYLGTDGETVNLYDADFNVIMHPPDALMYSGRWITQDEFVYLRLDGTDAYIQGAAEIPSGDPDLMSMSVDGDEPVLVIEDFGAEPVGDLGPYADGNVLPGTVLAACG